MAQSISLVRVPVPIRPYLTGMPFFIFHVTGGEMIRNASPKHESKRNIMFLPLRAQEIVDSPQMFDSLLGTFPLRSEISQKMQTNLKEVY